MVSTCECECVCVFEHECECVCVCVHACVCVCEHPSYFALCFWGLLSNKQCLHPFVCSANKSGTELRRLYFKLRERVFVEKKMATRSAELESFIQEELGTTARMSDVQHPK